MNKKLITMLTTACLSLFIISSGVANAMGKTTEAHTMQAHSAFSDSSAETLQVTMANNIEAKADAKEEKPVSIPQTPSVEKTAGAETVTTKQTAAPKAKKQDTLPSNNQTEKVIEGNEQQALVQTDKSNSVTHKNIESNTNQTQQPSVAVPTEKEDTHITSLLDEITPTTLLYEVDYAGQNAGELEISLNKAGNALTVNSISHLSSLAKLFLDPYTIKTHFVITNGDIQIISSTTRQSESNDVEHGFNIDHSKNEVSFYSGDRLNFAPETIFEADSFPIKLITSDIKHLEGTEILAISGKRVTAYAYTETAEENLSINGKNFNTVRITRKKVGDPERTVTFWLDQDNHHLPVKIVSRSRGVNTELKIKS